MENDLLLEDEGPDAQIWAQLSLVTQKARLEPSPSAINDMLADHVKRDGNGTFAPAYALWAADNLRMEKRFEDAAASYREFADQFGDRPFDGAPFGVHALEELAVCQERLDDVKAARMTYEEILSGGPKGVSHAWMHFQIGQLAERMRDESSATSAYRAAEKVDDDPPRLELSVRDLARRAADRLESDRAWLRPTAEDVVMELGRALRSRDAAALDALASPTHFTVGIAGSEMRFPDAPRERILELLAADLADSNVRWDGAGLEGRSTKLYLPTDGWRGALMAGRVYFLVCRCASGWEWFGLAFTQRTEAWDELFGPIEIVENQPLPHPIHAPWPRGASFRAGGVLNFSAEAAAVAFIGGPFLAGLLSDHECGWGPAGNYYNQFNHSGSEAFGIDFTRYRRGSPLVDAARGTPVLACDGGVVVVTQTMTPDGMHSPSPDNRVEINHRVAAEPWTRDQLGGAAQTKLRSKYLHLRGPGLVRVSRFMWVRPGSVLGFMDDTGFSLLNHLHFSMHDRDRGMATMRPTPMFGPSGLQTLNDGENYKTIRSVNRPL